jgi:thioredoxin reductase (NADPH)
VTEASASDGVFALATLASGTLPARRLVLATGMRDFLPDVPGLAECWGRTAIQCPYCHGYELADRPTGVLMSGSSALHQARLLTHRTDDLVLFLNGHAIAGEDRADLARRGVALVEGRVARVVQDGGRLSAVALEDGAAVAREVLYVTTRSEPSAPFARDLGCAMAEGPAGPFVKVDALQATSAPGVWAAGDMTRAVYNAVLAAADGARAGMACHRSLLMDGAP